jgi:tetratricopeptide (TPR) repeat protein
VKHLEEEEIKLFVEGRFDRIHEGEVARHLRDCAQCRQEYKTAVLFNWFQRREREPVPDVRASAVPAPEAPGMRAGSSARLARAVDYAGKRVVLATAASVIAVCAVAVWLAVGTGVDEGGSSAVIRSLKSSAATLSSRSEFVLPGTEGSFTPGVSAYRSGFVTDDEELTDALLELTDRKNAGEASRDELYWLAAGFTSAGLLDEAALSAGDALDRYPGDGDLLTLAGVIQCMSGDLSESERMLREAVAAEPGNLLTRLDLAVTLLRAGRKEEAGSLLRSIVEADPDSPLAQRAAALNG